MDTLEACAEIWVSAKEAEAKAIAKRREAEDRMLSLIGVSESHEGTTNAESGL